MLGSGRPTTGRPKKYSERANRDKKLCIRINSADLNRLKKCAMLLGMTVTDFVILNVKEGCEEVMKIERKKK